jgi:hypothetical protein
LLQLPVFFHCYLTNPVEASCCFAVAKRYAWVPESRAGGEIVIAVLVKSSNATVLVHPWCT